MTRFNRLFAMTIVLLFFFIRVHAASDETRLHAAPESPVPRYLLLANPNLTNDYTSSHVGRLADFDLDGDMDMVLHQGDVYEILANEGDGEMISYGRLAVDEEFGGGVAAGDFNGDGAPDLLLSGMTTLLVNTGVALFNRGPDLPGMAARYEAADLDGDGDLDALALSSGTLHIWLNQGGVQGGTEGVFVDEGNQFEEIYIYDVIAAGDVDGDGDPDIVVRTSDHEAQLWLNQGGAQGGQLAQFADSGQRIGTTPMRHLALGDVDGDGDLDAFVVRRDFENHDSGPPNEVWQNVGGEFSDTGMRLGADDSQRVTLSDVDLDGDLDAVVMNDESGRVWLNSGGLQGGQTGAFEEGELFQVAGAVFWADGADLDGDGYPDYVGGGGYRSMLWLNRDSASLGQAGFFYRNLPEDFEGGYIYDWWEPSNGVLPVALRQSLPVPTTISAHYDYAIPAGASPIGVDLLEFPVGAVSDLVTAGEDDPGGEADRVWNPYQLANPLLGETAEVAVTLQENELLTVDGPENLTIVFHNPDSALRRCFLEGMNFLIERLLVPEEPAVMQPDGLGIPLRVDLEVFRDVRDEVMADTPQGQFYAGLYEAHSPELLQILTKNTNMLDEIGRGLQTWSPMLEALVAGEGHTVTISPGMVEQALSVLERFEAEASPELAGVIQEEREALNLPDFTGLTLDEALARVNAREMESVYLPAIYGE